MKWVEPLPNFCQLVAQRREENRVEALTNFDRNEIRVQWLCIVKRPGSLREPTIKWYRSTGWDGKWCSSAQNRYIFEFARWSKPDFVTLVLQKWRHLLGQKITVCFAASKRVHFDRHCDQSHLVWNLPPYYVFLSEKRKSFSRQSQEGSSMHNHFKLLCNFFARIASHLGSSVSRAPASLSVGHRFDSSKVHLSFFFAMFPSFPNIWPSTCFLT